MGKAARAQPVQRPLPRVAEGRCAPDRGPGRWPRSNPRSGAGRGRSCGRSGRPPVCGSGGCGSGRPPARGRPGSCALGGGRPCSAECGPGRAGNRGGWGHLPTACGGPGCFRSTLHNGSRFGARWLRSLRGSIMVCPPFLQLLFINTTKLRETLFFVEIFLKFFHGCGGRDVGRGTLTPLGAPQFKTPRTVPRRSPPLRRRGSARSGL